MPKIDIDAVTVRTGSALPARHAASMAGRRQRALGDAGGLTQFGVNLVVLDPGAASSLRHWHQEEDEFVMVLAGRPTLVEDAGPQPLGPGDCAAFPAGVPDGHTLVNEAAEEVRLLVVGTRAQREVGTYSDVDLRIEIEGREARFTRRDGSPLPDQGEQT